MDVLTLVQASIERVRAADREAISASAFAAAGRFDEYWEQKGREAQARIDAILGEVGPAPTIQPTQVPTHAPR